MFQTQSPRPHRAVACVLLATLAFCFAARADATTLSEARKLRLKGEYQDCLRACARSESQGEGDEEWRLLEAAVLLDVGQYPQAENVVSNALLRYDGSIRLRLLGIETANAINSAQLARTRLREINQLGGSRLWAYRDPENLVTLGRAALLLGGDPKTVLERFFTVAQQADANLREAWLASGQLALAKHDYALAAKTYLDALKKFPDDPDLLCGLAQAYQPSARGKMLELLASALAANEHHVPSLLLLTDHQIDAEEYVAADKTLARALKVNPWHPRAWAYRAVLAHLRNNQPDEAQARASALKFWPSNPEVDHLIGLKLSQKYRFAEGSACQQRALAFDPDFLPARIQLAEDWLRLGRESDGWKFAEQGHQHDAYDVTAYNLATLHGTMQKFQTLTNQDFVLRMSPTEAALYGVRALALLQRAKEQLTRKYGFEIESPTYVEIFPEQKDFGVRTFGMPHNPGFLGVCFGRVVTATSPAAQPGHPANWEAVLWHEFCHVVTLQLTKNKMPRWLSEGISVYEERQANPIWGQTMNPEYRGMVLGEDLTPISQLSSAFMSPKSDLHVQFAYYESSLVVEYLVGQFGFDKLTAILRELGDGVEINEAIARHTAPLGEVERQFAAFAKARAEALGPGLDWVKPAAKTGLLQRLGMKRPPLNPEVKTNKSEPTIAPKATATNELAEAIAPTPAKPNDSAKLAEVASRVSGLPNYWVLLEQAAQAVAGKKWAEAKAPLKMLIELCPDASGPNHAYALLASVHRGLNETAEERAVLEKRAMLEADASEAYSRLMELAGAAKDWKAVAQNAERFLAVNPLVPQPYRFLARAGEELGEAASAIGAYQKLLLLDPADPAEIHFRLARLLQSHDAVAAKRHALEALAEAPRFRAAHRLLLELAQANPVSTNAAAEPKP